MKKVLLLLGLFSTGVSFAQSEEPKEEWREIIEPFTENVQMFGSLEREKIPYGILSDYAIETANLKLYDGKHQADSIVMDRTVLAEIYRTLQMGRIHDNSAEHFISFEDYSKRWRDYRKNSLTDITDTIPTIYLSGVYYKYAKIAENAIEEQKIRYEDNRLLDKYVNNVWQNPYETVATIAVAAPFNVFKSRNIKVALPQDLFLSNEYDLTDIAVDFEDGNGFQSFEFGQEIPVSYTQNGSYTWKFRFKTPAGEWLSTRIPIEIDFPILIELPATSEFSIHSVLNGKHSAILRIKHIPGNDITITRPFIVAEGFDPATILYPEYPQGDISYHDFVQSLIDAESDDLSDLLRHANNAEYDIVYIDWVNGVGDIRKNAETLEMIINWVNDQKAAANSTEENVLMGQSMGGLVSKYALVKMEQKDDDHQVGLFIAHDSPFRGANVPPSVQFMTRHMLGLYMKNPLAMVMGELLMPFIASFEDVDEDQADEKNILEQYVSPSIALTLQDTPAAVQMNSYYVNLSGNPTTVFHDDWQNEFDALGYPQQSRNIAISNGNMCAIDQGFTAGDYLLNIRKENSSPAYFKTLIRDFAMSVWGAGAGNFALPLVSLMPGKSNLRLYFEVKSTPEQNNGNRMVYSGTIKYDKHHIINNKWKKTFVLTERVNTISNQFLPMDVFSGGVYSIDNIASVLDSFFPDGSYTNKDFNFVAVPSSLDIKRNNQNPTLLDYRKAYNSTNLNDINLSSGFDNFITETSTFGVNNYEHISFSPKNGNWLAQELNARRVTTTNPPNADCSFFCGTHEIYGADIICDKTTVYTYSIPELPTGTEIEWSASGLEIISEENGGSVVKVKAIDSGLITSNLKTLTVTVNLPGCGEIRITKRIHYGKPTTAILGSITGPNPIPVLNNQNFSTALTYTAPNAPGVTHYEWVFPGNFQVVSSFGNPLSIPQNWQLLGPGNSQEVVAKSNLSTNGQIKVRACNECGCSEYVVMNVTHQHYNIPGWELAPNPTTGDNLNIMRADGAPAVEFPGNRTDVFIYNLQAQRVHQFEITSEGGSTNVAHLAEGIYKVQIDMKNGNFEVLNLQISR